jgi:hypothetical protein
MCSSVQQTFVSEGWSNKNVCKEDYHGYGNLSNLVIHFLFHFDLMPLLCKLSQYINILYPGLEIMFPKFSIMLILAALYIICTIGPYKCLKG